MDKLDFSQFQASLARDAAATTTISIILSIISLSLLCSTLTGPTTAWNPIAQYIRKRITAWRYLLNGPRLIEEGYRKSDGEPYEVLAPDSRYVFISSPKHIKELDHAPDAALSLLGAAKHMLQPKYTMNGFNWFERRGVEGIGFVRTLRTLLTNNLPQILPDLSIKSKTVFDELLETHPVVNGTRHSPVYPMLMKLVVQLNALALFGQELVGNVEFMSSALPYVEQTLLISEVVKLLPGFLKPVVGSVLSRRLNAQKTFFGCLVPATELRVQERDLKQLGHDVPKRADCIQWIIDTAPKQNPWSAERVINELMAIWFGSVHILTTTIVYAVQDLCLHPEYIDPIRRELESDYAEFERTAKGLPLLDSFLRESARLTPVESMSTRRRALQPFTFSDGTALNVGDWACSPSGVMMRDPSQFPSPERFDGFRFVDPAVLENLDRPLDPQAQPKTSQKPAQFTDIDSSFLMWGYGRMACPGRYYASAFMKVVVGQILMKYDLKLVEPDAPRWMTWRAAMLPSNKTTVVFTPRS
ncbi:Ent-kaurene oxidase [Madurella mycetomatis]|uniref:Ent-kaurene oxidase n=1 Tax=Madurella mycetomatis TaxID=100816 RepID=A0A175VWB8_9PEZI|nr:Ent-kaurene oxidase [Madurella mycetomatis]